MMKSMLTLATATIVLFVETTVLDAFVPSSYPHINRVPTTAYRATLANDLLDLPAQEDEASTTSHKMATAPKPKKSHSKEGVFSPIVVALKETLGDEELNKLRAKVIKLHSDIIGGFVDTAKSSLGQDVLRQLFRLADSNADGRIEESELRRALRMLGFDWLKDKQVKGIFKRADKDENGWIDLEEWMTDAPKTLKTNLVKLAKKNGEQMGLLV